MQSFPMDGHYRTDVISGVCHSGLNSIVSCNAPRINYMIINSTVRLSDLTTKLVSPQGFNSLIRVIKQGRSINLFPSINIYHYKQSITKNLSTS
jgi:hypothetical protein